MKRSRKTGHLDGRLQLESLIEELILEAQEFEKKPEIARREIKRWVDDVYPSWVRTEFDYESMTAWELAHLILELHPAPAAVNMTIEKLNALEKGVREELNLGMLLWDYLHPSNLFD